MLRRYLIVKDINQPSAFFILDYQHAAHLLANNPSYENAGFGENTSLDHCLAAIVPDMGQRFALTVLPLGYKVSRI